MLQQILTKRAEIKEKRLNEDLIFSDPKDSETSQLKQAKDFIINKIPLRRDFSWEIPCSWKQLKNQQIMQNQIKLQDYDIDLIVKKYQAWVKINNCYAIKLPKTKKHPNGIGIFRCAKRGNSIYRKLLYKTLENATSFMDEKSNGTTFEDKVIENVDGFRKKKKASVLFISLTVSPKKVNNNLVMAWCNIQKYYNHFITAFRQKYGETFVIKTVESQENGFPHIHLFVICEHRFDAFEHQKFNKNRGKWEKSWRVNEKNIISKFWKLGFSDVKVPINVSEQPYPEFIRDYMFKDMFKSFKLGDKSLRDLKSLALNWLFGMRSFSISHLDLIRNVSITQIQKQEIEEYCKKEKGEFLGFINISCKTSKPPPDNCFISENNEDYKNVLSRIRKPRWLVEREKEKQIQLEKEKIRLKNLKHKNQKLKTIKVFKNTNITEFEIIKNTINYQPKTLIANFFEIIKFEDIPELTKIELKQKMINRVISPKSIKLGTSEKIELAVKGVT